MDEDIKTRIRPGGLRYESKTPGTAFPGSFGVTLSCFLCGRHRPRSLLATFTAAGKRQLRCKDGC